MPRYTVPFWTGTRSVTVTYETGPDIGEPPPEPEQTPDEDATVMGLWTLLSVGLVAAVAASKLRNRR